MRLHILPDRLVSDIQEQFNEEFPFLDLVFFKKGTASRSDKNTTKQVPGNWKIADIQVELIEGIMDVSGEMKVKDLEKRLKDEFTLSTQVLRKSGNLWLETTMTDNWTLDQQNNHGREISTTVTAEGHDLNRDVDY